PAAFIAEALRHPQPEGLVPFVAAVAPTAGDTSLAALLSAASSAPGSAAPLQNALLRGLAQRGAGTPASLAGNLVSPLRSLIPNPATSAAALELAAKWNASGQLAGDMTAAGRRLLSELSVSGTKPERRAEI